MQRNVLSLAFGAALCTIVILSPNGALAQVCTAGQIIMSSDNMCTPADSTIAQDGAGNVGIGTTNPFDILHVARERSNNGTDDLAQVVVSGSGATNDRLLLGYNTTDDNGFIQSLHHALGVTNLLLNPNGGNIGIGTSGPNARLQVAGGDAAITTQGNGMILRATGWTELFPRYG